MNAKAKISQNYVGISQSVLPTLCPSSTKRTEAKRHGCPLDWQGTSLGNLTSPRHSNTFVCSWTQLPLSLHHFRNYREFGVCDVLQICFGLG